MQRVVHSLRFQIVVAIALIVVLFASATLYSLYVIERQHDDDVLVDLASRLQFNLQQLAVQAMRYEENAPRDYPSYSRDLNLYFQDLRKTRAELDRIVEAFVRNRFGSDLTGKTEVMSAGASADLQAAGADLGEAWRGFVAGLEERIGPDQEQPRLESAAQWIVDQHEPLEEVATEVRRCLRDEIELRASRASLINRLLFASALLLSLGIAVWFYRRVAAPLTEAVDGFKQVANGDFSHRVPVRQDNEIGWLSAAFNHLSDRLEALRRLLTRLEEGGDLDGTLRVLSQTLPALIPVDWIGVLVIGVDGNVHLEKAYQDGERAPVGRLKFVPDQTLLEECIRTREPLHVSDVQAISRLSDSYVFLRQLSDMGRRDAVFLPIGNGAQVQGVAVFASRYPGSYRAEHLELLRNLGVLIGLSLGRTIQLAESSRLAAIGQFASGIAHEIRSPLATIGMALEHLSGLETLPPGADKRVVLATTEVGRLERLLADILLYAKPLTLNRSAVSLLRVLEDSIAAAQQQERFELHCRGDIAIDADVDRLQQVLINLLQNAMQASPADGRVRVSCAATTGGWASIDIENSGPPIPEKDRERIFEPFFTSKPGGTGLGLPIARRIALAHGGDISVHSDARSTRFKLTLPMPPAADQLAT